MKIKVWARWAVGLAASVLPASLAQAQTIFPPPPGTIFFDYFLADNAGQPQDDFNTFLQWNVTGGSVDLVGGNVPGIPGGPPDEPLGRFVDLGGSTGDPGLFETRLAYPVVPGTYNLSFEYRSTGGDLNSALATVGGETFNVSTNSTSFLLFSQDFAVTTPGLVRIAFQGAPGDLDNSGIGIDSVLFRQVAIAATPEPASWAMMIGGFGAAGVALRRRRRSTLVHA